MAKTLEEQIEEQIEKNDKQIKRNENILKNIPHKRGGEPNKDILKGIPHTYSPHAWG